MYNEGIARSRRFLLLTAALLALAPAADAAAQTSAFGNPARNVSSDTKIGSLPDRVWGSAVTGTRSSACGPVAAGGRAFVGTGDALRALDLTDGHTLWTSAPITHATTSDCPTADATRVIQNVDQQRVRAFAAGTGEVLWTRDFDGTDFTHPFLVGGRLFVTKITRAGNPWRAELYALDPATGDTLWSTPTDHTYLSAVVAGPTVLIVGETRVLAYDVTDGDLAWTAATAAEPSVTAADGEVYLWRSGVTALDAATGATDWTAAVPADKGVVADDDHVYAYGTSGTQSTLTALDPDTGATAWSRSQTAQTSACAPPVRFGDQVITQDGAYRTSDGAVLRTGAPRWARDACGGPPAVVGDRVLAWQNSEVALFRDATGPVAAIEPAATDRTDGTPDITWNVTDAENGGVGVATTSVRLDGTLISAAAQGTHTPSTPLATGTHTIAIEAADENGNASTTTRTFTVDATPPTDPTVSAPGAFAPSPTLVAAASVDPDGDATSIELLLDGFPSETLTGCEDGCSTSLAGLGEGPHVLSAVGVDAVGNRSAATRVEFTVDATPPTAPAAVAPAQGASVQGPNVTLSWTAADDLNGIAAYDVLLDGALTATVSGTSAALPVATGSHTWQVVARDPAGNTALSTPTSFTVTAPPAAQTPGTGTAPPAAPAPPAAARGTAPRGPFCGAATPQKQELRDAIGDSRGAADLQILFVDVEADCTIEITYGLKSNGLLTGDGLALGVDTDGDPNTGAASLLGADRFLSVIGPRTNLQATLAILESAGGVAEIVAPAPTVRAEQQSLVTVRTSVAALGLLPGRPAGLRFQSTVRGGGGGDLAPEVTQPAFPLTVQFTSAGSGPAAAPRPGTTSTTAAKKPARPKLSGTARVGKTLTCTAAPAMRAKKAKPSYRWTRNGKAIKGATKRKLKLARADRGKKVGCTVKAKVDGRTVTVTSAAKKVAR